MTIELRASERRGIVEMRWCLRILSVRVLAGLLLNAPSGTIDPRRAEESWLTGHVVLGVGGLAVGGAACSPLALRCKAGVIRMRFEPPFGSCGQIVGCYFVPRDVN